MHDLINFWPEFFSKKYVQMDGYTSTIGKSLYIKFLECPKYQEKKFNYFTGISKQLP